MELNSGKAITHPMVTNNPSAHGLPVHGMTLNISTYLWLCSTFYFKTHKVLYIRNFALLKCIGLCWVWWHTPVNPAFRRQKNHKFETHLGCIMRPFKKQKQSQIKQATLVLKALYIRCILTNPYIFIIIILKRESLLLKFYL